MFVFKACIYLFIAIAVLTGANDLLQGISGLKAMGAGLTDAGYSDPLLDSLFRFFAGLWMGTGLLFWIFIRDLRRYKPAMMALLGVVILGGIGRLLTIAQLGLPEAPIGLAMVSAGLFAELLLSPLLLAWLAFKHRSEEQDRAL